MTKHKDKSIRNLRIESRMIRAIAQGSWFVGAFGPWFSPIPELKPFLGIGVYAYLALSIYRHLAIDSAISDNNEFKEFTKIYKEVLGDMVDLSKTLDNKSAIEHHALYQYILDHDYLSCGKTDNMYHSVLYESFLAPEYALNGHGVCRHQAAMGSDFFSALGFENNFEICYLSKDNSAVPQLEFIKSGLEEHIETLNKTGCKEEVELYKTFLKAIDMAIKEAKDEEDNKKKKKFNNHAIVKVNEDENTFFFDTSQRTFYTATEDNPNIFSDYKGKTVDLSVDLKDRKKYNKISPVIPTNNLLPISDIRDEYLKSIVKLADNDDLIRKFNKENNDRLERAEEIYIRSLRK